MTLPTRNPGSTIVMVGTSIDTMGGISTVVKGYIAAGLFDRVPITYIQTHGDGSGFEKLKMACRGYIRFVRVLASESIGLIHIHLSSRASFWRKLPFVMAGRILRKPVLLHLHGSEFMTFFRGECGPVRKKIISLAFDSAATVIALSPQWANDIKEISPDANIKVILNRVPVPSDMPTRKETGRETVILFLGRLGRRKGIYDLLEALKTVKASGVHFRLIAAGDGEISQVKARAKELGLDSVVEVPGWIGEDDRNRLLAKADIFVLPSHAEGLPMSLLEAMAAGIPVVCTSVGGIPIAVTHGVEGLVVSPGSIPELASALGCMIDNLTLRTQIGKRAFNRARAEFDVQLSVDEIVSLYKRYVAL